MEVHNQESAGSVTENLRREAQLRNEDQSAIKVPEMGNDSLNRVTKLPEAQDLSGSPVNRTNLLILRHVNNQENQSKVWIILMMQVLTAHVNRLGSC